MPIVGNQKFPYTAAGQMAAQQTSKKTGKPMKIAPGMGKGFAPPPPMMPPMGKPKTKKGK